MPIAINGDGSVTGITAGGYPNASVNTEDLNAGTASAGQSLVAGGATGAMSWGSSIVLGTPQNSTSGTSIDFTGIPSWARRITVMLNGVSTNGTSNIQVQLGAGSITASGYSSYAFVTTSATSSSTGFIVTQANAANYTQIGHMTITNLSGNTWVYSSLTNPNTGNTCSTATGVVTLSGTLDRVRITTVNGTDQFDAGSINISWE